MSRETVISIFGVFCAKAKAKAKNERNIKTINQLFGFPPTTTTLRTTTKSTQTAEIIFIFKGWKVETFCNSSVVDEAAMARWGIPPLQGVASNSNQTNYNKYFRTWEGDYGGYVGFASLSLACIDCKIMKIYIFPGPKPDKRLGHTQRWVVTPSLFG